MRLCRPRKINAICSLSYTEFSFKSFVLFAQKLLFEGGVRRSAATKSEGHWRVKTERVKEWGVWGHVFWACHGYYHQEFTVAVFTYTRPTQNQAIHMSLHIWEKGSRGPPHHWGNVNSGYLLGGCCFEDLATGSLMPVNGLTSMVTKAVVIGFTELQKIRKDWKWKGSMLDWYGVILRSKCQVNMNIFHFMYVLHYVK